MSQFHYSTANLPKYQISKTFLIQYIVHWSRRVTACSFHLVEHFLEFALKRRGKIAFLGKNKWGQDQFLDFHIEE